MPTHTLGTGAPTVVRVTIVVALLLAPVQGARSQCDARASTVEPNPVSRAEPPAGATVLLLHLAEPPAAGYRRMERVFESFDYTVAQDDLPPLTLTARQHVRGVGVVDLTAKVLPDSLGAVVQLSGERRHLRRYWIFTGIGPPARIEYGSGAEAQGAAWRELAAVGAAMCAREVRYQTGVPPRPPPPAPTPPGRFKVPG